MKANRGRLRPVSPMQRAAQAVAPWAVVVAFVLLVAFHPWAGVAG